MIPPSDNWRVVFSHVFQESFGADCVGWIDFIGDGVGVIQIRNKTADEFIQEFSGGEHNLEFAIPTGKLAHFDLYWPELALTAYSI
jgi:hypothetical protein